MHGRSCGTWTRETEEPSDAHPDQHRVHLTILRPLEEVAALKETEGGPIILHGSASLNQALSDAGLIDHYHLIVYPLLLGAGKRLFSATDKDTQKLKLVEHEAYPNGLQKNVFDVIH